MDNEKCSERERRGERTEVERRILTLKMCGLRPLCMVVNEVQD